MDGYTVCKDEYDQDYVKPTENGVQEQRRIRLKLLLKETGIVAPKYSFDDYKGDDEQQNIPKIKKYIAEFETKFNNVNLYLWSKGNASQKTTVAKNIIVELSLKGFDCYFILMADLLSLLQTETYHNGTESKIVNRLRNVDFLVIDDVFDPKKSTVYKSGYQFSFIDAFLRYRLESVAKATCFTSNVPINEIEKKGWTTSLANLIKRSVHTPMEFNDYLDNFKREDIWA